ncbi:MAG: sugar phosphate nucleotidyltransferase, partial [Sphingomonas sp.]
AGEPIADGVREVAKFIEKPDLARAEGFVADGGYSWNAGIFLFSVAAMRAALVAHAPQVLAAAEASMAKATETPTRIDPHAAEFAAATAISIDNAVFEHATRVAVCAVDPGWSDIGSWDALQALGPADAAGNVASGRVESVDTQGCLLRAEGVILATVGIADLNIIATPDAVLVTRRGRSQEVRSIAARLAGDPVLTRPLIEHRPWGEEHVVHDGTGTAVRKVRLADGAQRPLAPHQRVMLVSGVARGPGGALVAGELVANVGAITGEKAGVVLIFG